MEVPPRKLLPIPTMFAQLIGIIGVCAESQLTKQELDPCSPSQQTGTKPSESVIPSSLSHHTHLVNPVSGVILMFFCLQFFISRHFSCTLDIT